jgi:hypothetical protein
MEEQNNYEDAAMRDLQNREYQAEETSTSNVVINEQEEKPTSLGRSATFLNPDASEEPALLPGYHEIYANNFPSKGLFYNDGARFFIRAAAAKEIRHFSTINEEDPFSIDEALNEIVKSCLMIRFPGKQASFKDLKEEDRIYIIMNIRELTFSKGENQLKIEKTCNECNHTNEIEITSRSFEATLPPDNITKYYDYESKVFNVQTKSCGNIIITPPSVGVMMEVTKYIRKSSEEGKKIDQSFVKLLPYLLTEWRGLNEQRIKNLEIEFMQWDTTRYSVYNTLIEWARVGIKENITTSCLKCGSEVTAPISFPNGIKSLFVVSDISGELL